MDTDSDSDSTMNLQDPDLILLFTWTGAQPHHITQYISGYSKLFPSSPIMVITSSINDLLYRRTARKQRSLIPAILTLLSSNLDSNFLVHCLSESGTQKCVQFAKAFLKSTGRQLPISALCLDTARGTLHYTETAQWREKSARGNPAFQFVTSVLAYMLAASCWTTWPIIGDAFMEDSEHLFNKSRRAPNDSRLWDVQAPRCYLLSSTDKLTNPGSVVEHARSAEKLGAPIILAQFEEDGHSGHVKSPSNAARYWATVQRTWDASTGTPSTKYRPEIEKPAYIHVTDVEKEAGVHVSIHELPSQHSPVAQTAPPILSASSSIYSDDHGEEFPIPAARAPASSYNGPANFCIKKEKSSWYDCLRPVPGYQGWGGMGVDTDSYSYDRLTEKPNSYQSLYRYFYAGI